MSKVLIIAEHDGSSLNPSTQKCVSCASEISNSEIHLIILASDISSLSKQAASIDAVTKVIAIEHEIYNKPLTVNIAPQIFKLANEYTHILGPSTTFGKDLMPHIAALLGVNQISDIMKVLNSHQFQRPIYAGNAILTVEASKNHVVVATVRTASYKAAKENNQAAIEVFTSNIQPPNHTRFIKYSSGSSDRPDLQTANIVVSGGRAVGSSENFEMIYKLADVISAATGASRAAVDAGYVPNEMQVGQTGKIIAPDLYIAIGISGAIQHITGIKDAGTIVAINKDENAPIFEVADIGLVGDLFKIVPELHELLNS